LAQKYKSFSLVSEATRAASLLEREELLTAEVRHLPAGSYRRRSEIEEELAEIRRLLEGLGFSRDWPHSRSAGIQSHFTCLNTGRIRCHRVDLPQLDGIALRRYAALLVPNAKPTDQLGDRPEALDRRSLRAASPRPRTRFLRCCLRAGPRGVAKRKDGRYEPTRTQWLKVKNPEYSQARDRAELFERLARDGTV
jgi:hypothetical protein